MKRRSKVTLYCSTVYYAASCILVLCHTGNLQKYHSSNSHFESNATIQVSQITCPLMAYQAKTRKDTKMFKLSLFFVLSKNTAFEIVYGSPDFIFRFCNSLITWRGNCKQRFNLIEVLKRGTIFSGCIKH